MASTTTRRPRTTTPQTRTGRGRTRPSTRGTTSPPGGMRATAQARAAAMARSRRKQQPTGLKGVMAKLPDAIPTPGKRSKSSSKNPISGIVSALPIGGSAAKRGKSSSSSTGKRAGGAALVAGAAGLALKNRNKITSMIKGGDGGSDAGRTDTDAGTTDASVSRLDVTPSDVTTPPQQGTTPPQQGPTG